MTDFRDVAEAIPQQVWTAEPGGRLDYVNRRVLEYLERSFEDVVANGWQDAIHPDDAAGVLARWEGALKSGVPYDTEFRLRRAGDGAWRWHLGRALPVIDAKHEIVRWFGTNTDIDDHRRAIESRDDLLTVVSKDLKSPIALVVTEAGALIKTLPSEMRGERQRAESIRHAADRMQGIVHSFLDLEQIRQGRMILDRSAHDPTALVLDAFESHRTRAAAKSIRLERETPPRLSIQCDGKRMVQALSQIVSYAVDNAPSGGRVVVRVARAADAFEIVVTDSGKPLRDDELEAVFDRAWRPRAADAEATGRGLAICKAIVEAHRGSVRAVNDANGTSFVVTLP